MDGGIAQRALDRRQLPALLREIHDPPERLWCAGDTGALDRPVVAIVGSRRCSAYGRDVAFSLAEAVARAGVTVVSGLAYGIDAAAHRGALAGGGLTAAFLGGGLDAVYPAAHDGLARQIVAAGGVLATEYDAGVKPRRHHFPARNRLISGVALGVVIVEAAERSGSLITARMALEQNREVMAVPGMVTNPLAAGCHALLRDGAALVAGARDIVETLGLDWQEPAAADDAKAESADPVLAAVGAEATSVDAIAAAAELSVEAALARLVELELAGFVTARAGGYSRRLL